MSTTGNSVGEMIGGLALSFIFGILNGSYNAAFDPNLALATGPRASMKPQERKFDLDFNHAWMLFQIYSTIINATVCLLWAGGPSNVLFVLGQATTASIVLLVIFSFLWGIGSFFFGRACKIAGVGIGTNLTMSIVLMLGTFLPLMYDGGIKSITGVVIIVGLLVVCFGLYFSAESLRMRDLDIMKAENLLTVKAKPSCSVQVSAAADPINSEDSYSIQELQQNEAEQNPEHHVFAPDLPRNERNDNVLNQRYSSTAKIFVCVVAGLCSSLLQFAFIFGREIIQIAEKDASTPKGGSAAIIWLFAISIESIPSIFYGICSSSNEIPLKSIWLSPCWRHLAICITSFVWLSHIHTYGLSANVLLPKKFAAGIAWPTMMTTSVATGMVLSMCLGEWKGASSIALSNLWRGLILSATGVILFMSSIAFK